MINTFSYGIPFYSNKIFFESDCDCKRIKKAKYICNELDKNDQLKGMKDINLTGIIIDSNSFKKENLKKNKNKSNFSLILDFKMLRFQQIENKMKKTKDIKCLCDKIYDGINGI